MHPAAEGRCAALPRLPPELAPRYTRRSHSGGVITQDVATGAITISSGCRACHIMELLRSCWRSSIAKLFKPGLIVIKDFNRAIGRESQALVIKGRVDALLKEGREEVCLFLCRETPIRVHHVRVDVNQTV